MPAAAEGLRPPRQQRLLAVDAWRGFGCLGVIATHSNIFPVGQLMDGPGLWQRIAHLVLYYTEALLDMLFVISGYLVSAPWIRALLDGRRLPDAKAYARRRIARIVPLFWITLFVICATPPGRTIGTLREPGWLFVRQMFLLVPPTPSQNFGLFVAWSLQVEVVFYLTMPVLCRVTARLWPDPAQRLRVLLWGAAFVVLVGLVTATVAGLLPYHHPWQRPLRFSVPAGLALVVPGVLLAASETQVFADTHPRFMEGWQRLTGSLGLVILASASVVALTLAMEATGNVLGFTLARLPRVAVEAAILHRAVRYAPQGRRVPVLRVLAALGTISYGLYLWHDVWLDFLPYHLITNGLGTWWQNYLMLLGISVGCSIVTWWTIERPIIRWSLRPPRRLEQRLPLVRPARR